MCIDFVRFMFVGVVVLLLSVECIEAQQQGNFNHTTATLSEARWDFAATSSRKLVFFAGGNNSQG
jgi:hypothetical protein